MPETQNEKKNKILNKNPLPKSSFINKYASKYIWILAIVWMFFNMGTVAIKSYAPIFLVTEHNFSPFKAAGISSIIMFASTVTAPIAGIVSRFFNIRKFLLITGTLLAAFVMWFFFRVSSSYAYILLALIGITGGTMPMATFSLAPELMKDPDDADIGMSIITLGQNSGMFLGPVLFSTLAGYSSWAVAGGAIAILLILASFMSFFVPVVFKRS